MVVGAATVIVAGLRDRKEKDEAARSVAAGNHRAAEAGPLAMATAEGVRPGMGMTGGAHLGVMMSTADGGLDVTMMAADVHHGAAIATAPRILMRSAALGSGHLFHQGWHRAMPRFNFLR